MQHIRDVKNDQHISHAFASSNENIGNEQTLEPALQGIPNAENVRRMMRFAGDVNESY